LSHIRIPLHHKVDTSYNDTYSVGDTAVFSQ
jgi:hypothetical protein